MVLIDSSVWIEALRRSGSLPVKLAVEGLLEAYEAQWCAPVRLEVIGGARRDQRRRLAAYFAVVPYRTVSTQDWENALTLAWKLRDAGLSVPWLDVLIVSLALQDDIRVYAIDRHFATMADFTGLRLYQPGYAGGFAAD